MMHLKWILLVVCVALALWPLLTKRADHGNPEGKHT